MKMYFEVNAAHVKGNYWVVSQGWEWKIGRDGERHESREERADACVCERVKERKRDERGKGREEGSRRTVVNGKDAKSLVMDSLEVLNPGAKDVVIHLCITKDKSTSMGIQHNNIHTLERDLPSRVASTSFCRDLLSLERADPVGPPGVALDDHRPVARYKHGAESEGGMVPLVGEHGSGEIDDAEEEVGVEGDMFGAGNAQVYGVDKGGDDEDDEEDEADKGVQHHPRVLEYL